MSPLLCLLVLLPVSATPIRLEEARAAARRNTEALRAELDARRAQAGVGLARSAIYPQVELGASVSGSAAGPQRFFTTVPEVTAAGAVGFRQEAVDVPASTRGALNLSLTVSQLLYDGGRWWRAIAQSGAQADAALGQAQEQQLSSELEAVRRFYGLYRAQRTLQVLQATAATSAQQLDRANALFEAGRTGKKEALSAQVNLGNDRISVLRGQGSIESAAAELAVWLTRSGAEPLEAVAPEALSFSPAPLPSPEEALLKARAQRPLFQALEAQVRAARLGVELAAAGYRPRVGASASYNRQAPGLDPFFTDPSKQNQVGAGLSLSWPLFDGFATSAQEQQARHSLSSTELLQAQADRELQGDLRKAYSALEIQLQVVQLAAANRTVAEQALLLASERFEAGAGSTLEVRDAQLKLTQAELIALESRIDVEVARAALQRVMGIAWTGDEP